MHPTTKQDHCHQAEGPYPRDKLKDTRHIIQQLNHNFVSD